MRVFFYYPRTSFEVENKTISELINESVRIFKLKKEDIDGFRCIDSPALPPLTYQCIIDIPNPDQLLDRKTRFQDKADLLLSKQTGKNVRGSVRLAEGFDPLSVSGVPNQGQEDGAGIEELDYAKRSKAYVPTEPSYTFDRVVLPQDVQDKIEEAIAIIVHEDKVFRQWGLSAIQPNPSSALSFYGPSGTGKTMAAEAIAHKLGKKILKVSYADIESKYHGEGPKMVKAIFKSAQDNDVVLFIDEADSLLSKRLTNVTQGSEQAINSMRSQLLICLEEFHGIVIFATNLVVNYDKAFLTRLISIEFRRPSQEDREKIWEVHLKPTNGNGLSIPLSDDLDIKKLAADFDFCGREIRKAVISACVRASMDGREEVSQSDLERACLKVKDEEERLKLSTPN